MKEAKYIPSPLMHNRDQDIEYAQGNIESEFYSIDAKLDKFKRVCK